MGTSIQTVYETEAAELRMLGYLGCDVTTWGNHEFDYRSSGLANMLNTAKASGENVPSLVVCNVDWSAMEKAGLTEGQQQIKDAFENYGVKDYVVVQKGDVKIAVLVYLVKIRWIARQHANCFLKIRSRLLRRRWKRLRKMRTWI